MPLEKGNPPAYSRFLSKITLNLQKSHFYHENPQKILTNYLGFSLLLTTLFHYWHYINLQEDIQNSKLFKFFKDCLPKILLGLFLNTLTQMKAAVSIHRPLHCSSQRFVKKFCVS